jgi:hypothetical protein
MVNRAQTSGMTINLDVVGRIRDHHAGEIAGH